MFNDLMIGSVLKVRVTLSFLFFGFFFAFLTLFKTVCLTLVKVTNSYGTGIHQYATYIQYEDQMTLLILNYENKPHQIDIKLKTEYSLTPFFTMYEQIFTSIGTISFKITPSLFLNNTFFTPKNLRHKFLR